MFITYNLYPSFLGYRTRWKYIMFISICAILVSGGLIIFLFWPDFINAQHDARSRFMITKVASMTKVSSANPIIIKQARYLGEQIANNSCSHRDLGFAGPVAGIWYSVFGDTLWCAPGVSTPGADTPGFHGMVRDSVSKLTYDPLRVIDLHLNDFGRQTQLIPYNSAWGETMFYGFGGTSLCETDAERGTAALFYLVNAGSATATDPGGSVPDKIVGAGVAKVQIQSEGPVVTHRYGSTGWWWNSNKTACYGDVAAYRDQKSKWIYVWGNPPFTRPDDDGIYMARVPASGAFDLDQYEYWWGEDGGWKTEVLSEFGPDKAIWRNTGQGQVVWNSFYQTYIYVHVSKGATVQLRTAPTPGGPWSDDVAAYTYTGDDGGWVYAGVAYPYLDPSGQTLIVSFTSNNHIQVAELSFIK